MTVVHLCNIVEKVIVWYSTVQLIISLYQNCKQLLLGNNNCGNDIRVRQGNILITDDKYNNVQEEIY